MDDNELESRLGDALYEGLNLACLAIHEFARVVPERREFTGEAESDEQEQ